MFCCATTSHFPIFSSPPTMMPRRSPSIAARATGRETITAPSPACGQWIAPSMHWSAPSCCARAPTAISKTARAPACCTRSSGAPAPAPARSRPPITPNWCARRRPSSPAAPAPSRKSWPRRWSRRPRCWSSSAPRACVTVSPPSRPCRAARASIPARWRRPTCSPATRRAGPPASRCSSSAPGRTGVTALIIPAPTAPWTNRRCWAPSSRNSMRTNRPRASSFCPTRWRNRR